MNEETTKTRIVPLDDRSDYALWRIRVKAAISARKLSAVFSVIADRADEKTKEQMEEASNIIVSALSDHALRVVRSVIDDPAAMLAKLDDRYDSKTTASKITKMVELVSVRYSSLKDSMPRHVDKIAALVEQLQAMGTKLDNALVVGILIASITVDELKPASAAIKTLTDDNLKWEDVTARLIEEVKSLKVDHNQSSRQATHNQNGCAICGKSNHHTDACFLNPLNKDNKLGVNDEIVRKITDSATNGKTSPNPGESGRQGGRGSSKGGRSAMAKVKNSKVDRMMLDSGTSAHMTPLGNRLVDTRKSTSDISLADDSTVSSAEIGTRPVEWTADGVRTTVSLSKTMFVPALSTSLLSVPALVNKNIAVLFLPRKAVLLDLEDKNKVLGYALQDSDGLFYISEDDTKSENRSDKNKAKHWNTAMKATVQKLTKHAKDARLTDNGDSDATNEKISVSSNNTTSDLQKSENDGGTSCKEMNSNASTVWHNRLGHAIGVRAINLHLKRNILPRPVCPLQECEDCTKGKYRRRFGGSLTKKSTVGHLHVDTKGKIQSASVDGHHYFLTVVDEFSRHTAVIPIRTKGEASDELMDYVTRFERQTERKVKSVHSDGGSEFTKAFKSLNRQGVSTSRTTPYTPQSNGLAERSHGIILSMARTCLSESGLPFSYWNYAIRHVADCKNAVVHSATDKTPHDALYGEPAPYLQHLRPFGCKVFYQRIAKRLNTFEERTRTGVCLFHDGGGVYHIRTDSGDNSKVIRTKHVKFVESEFPNKSDSQCKPRIQAVSQSSETEGDADDSSRYSDSNADSDFGQSEVSLDDGFNSSRTTTESCSSSSEDSNSDDESDDDQSHPSDDEPLIMRALTYKPAEPSRHGETDEEPEPDNTRGTGTGYNLRRDLKPPARYTNTANMALPKTVTTSDEPKLSEALKSAERKYWLEAVREEFKTLEKNGTWEVHDNPPKGVKALPSGIILKIKRDEHSDPARFKARLVARGNFQSELEIEIDLYAPVACIEMVRLILSVAAYLGYDIEQLDVKGAFLHAPLPTGETIWLKLPVVPGLESVSGKVVKLLKSLYGLRQAPRLWYDCFADAVLSLGFKRTDSSFCLFVKKAPNGKVYVVVYVDDVLIIGPPQAVRETKESFKKLFTVTDLGKCKYFLGMKLDYRSDGLLLSQEGFAYRLLESANMVTCKPTRTPLPLAHPLYEQRCPTSDAEKLEMQDKPFRNLLGKLLYLANRTRPDLAAAVSLLAKYQSDPGPSHWTALKHLVRYVKGTTHYGILHPIGEVDDGLVVYCDADWGRDLEKRRSRTGYVAYYNSAPILWRSKLQSATATSTCEAEFAALSSCVKETLWLRMLLTDIGLKPDGPTLVHQDNLGTIAWSSDMIGLRKVKHVQIKYNHVCDEVENRSVEVGYTPSGENRADSLTKVLIGDSFLVHRKLLGVVPLSEDEHGLEGAC